MAEVISMPKLGFDMAEGTLVRWVKSIGDEVSQGEILAEIETDKATVEVESSASGVMRKHLVEEGTPVPVGDAIAIIGTAEEEIDVEALVGAAAEKKAEAPEPAAEEEAEAPREVAETAEAPADMEAEAQLPEGVKATPVARRIASEHGIQLQKVRGTGPDGRIVKKDVQAALEAAPEAPTPEAPAKAAEEAAPALTPTFAPGEPPPAAEQVPLSKLRGAIGRRMLAAKQDVPHFYLTTEVDAEPLMEMRKEINARLPEEQKVSVNDFIVKAAALALRQYPNLNASFAEDHIVRHGEINIGVAVAVEHGLLTVVVRAADRKPLRLIAQEAREVIKRAREGRVRPDDVEGSTFTVSNLGMFDIDHFIAIINPPEAGILAIGSVRQVPVVQDGEIKPGMRLKVTLSADHRVTDGAEGARWLDVLKRYLEDPLLLLM